MDIQPLYRYAVGMDVHLAVIMVCIIVQGSEDEPQVHLRKFGGFRRDRFAMAQWIASIQPHVVVMESTGIYCEASLCLSRTRRHLPPRGQRPACQEGAVPQDGRQSI